MRDRVRIEETGLICGRRFIAAQKTHYTPQAIAPASGGAKKRGKRLKSRLAIAAASLLVAGLLAAAITVAPSANVSVGLETAPSDLITVVTGTVYDSGGSPVIGAEVNVSMYDGETLRSYYEDTTTSDGSYSTTFGPLPGMEPWGVGDTILVVAEDGEYFGTNSTTAQYCAMQYVNVTLSTVIPEFGELGSLIPIAGVLSIFMAFFFARRERNS